MREEKKKRLAARGWKVGDTAEFLGLTPEETAYVELKMRLADGLRVQLSQPVQCTPLIDRRQIGSGPRHDGIAVAAFE